MRRSAVQVRQGPPNQNYFLMTKEQKFELAREMRTNMDLTKEQYLEMCKLCDELDLNRLETEPEEPSWDDILGTENN